MGLYRSGQTYIAPDLGEFFAKIVRWDFERIFLKHKRNNIDFDSMEIRFKDDDGIIKIAHLKQKKIEVIGWKVERIVREENHLPDLSKIF